MRLRWFVLVGMVVSACGFGTPGTSFAVLNDCSEPVRHTNDSLSWSEGRVPEDRSFLRRLEPGEALVWGGLAQPDGSPFSPVFVYVESVEGEGVGGNEELYHIEDDWLVNPEWAPDAEFGVVIRDSQCPSQQ